MINSDILDYDENLNRAYKNLPEKTAKTERFELPAAEVITQGNKTLIKNFDVITNKLRREPKHMAKYLFKELAVPGTIEGGRLILNSKLPERMIVEKIKNYIEIFLTCKQCKLPDTRLTEVDRGIYMMVCEACGARSAVPKV